MTAIFTLRNAMQMPKIMLLCAAAMLGGAAYMAATQIDPLVSETASRPLAGWPAAPSAAGNDFQ